MRHDSSTDSWNGIADDWVAHADTNDYRNDFLFPLTFRLLGDVAGKRVLDLGCGEGGYSRELARRGARVIGIDGSERLVEVAKERAAADKIGVDHQCANASALDGIASESFDVVLASMSLMDVEDYRGAIRETHRVLAQNGELLMSITHPCSFAPAPDRYFERVAWEEFLTRRFRRQHLRRHRPLEDYMQAPIESGFVLRDFREPSATAEDVKKSARFAQMVGRPYFLFMRWQKA